MSEFLKLNRGCRQGDPVSPYIFILCAEILGQMIRKSDNLHGIEIQGKEFRLNPRLWYKREWAELKFSMVESLKVSWQQNDTGHC